MNKVSFSNNKPVRPVSVPSGHRGRPYSQKKTFGAGNSRIGNLLKKQSGVSAEKIALLSGGVLAAAAVLYTAYQWDINAVPTLVGNGISQVRDWAGSMFTTSSSDQDKDQIIKDLRAQLAEASGQKCPSPTTEQCQTHIKTATKDMIKRDACPSPTTEQCQTHIKTATKDMIKSDACPSPTKDQCQTHIKTATKDMIKSDACPSPTKDQCQTHIDHATGNLMDQKACDAQKGYLWNSWP